MADFLELFSSNILPEEFLNKYRDIVPPFGFGDVGYITYKRTYARDLPDGSKEDWWQTVARCINGAQKIGAKYTAEEAQRLYGLIFNFKCIFAGRMLWQLGTPTVDRFGGNSLLNCWAKAIRKPEDFCFLFENLMLGGGVGFSIRKEDIYKLPRVKKGKGKSGIHVTHMGTKDADFIVPDSREGWVKLLHEVLNAHFKTGKSFTYSTILIRGKGEPIRGFGGVSSGPQLLIEGIEKIQQILLKRRGKQLKSVDVLDICNIIGSIVVAGNVRRSAEIALGDPDDYLFVRAKRWDLGNIPNWRAMSNNTVYADNYNQISDDVWTTFNGGGEPLGLFNLPLAQKYGRIGEEKEDNGFMLNPCGEIVLSDAEPCNLAELFLNNLESVEEAVECAKLLYKTQKAICALNYIHDETNAVVHKNMRIGMAVGGIFQSLEKLDWLDNIYKELRAYDKEWSKKNNWPESIKLTTVKPSGTVSLLAGATPGIHPAFSRYYIRRIKMSSDDPLVQQCREANYNVEYLENLDGTIDRNTVLVSFPVKSNSSKVSGDLGPITQLELVKKVQKLWADNSISVTVYYRKEDLPEIKEWLKNNYEDNIKSISFCLHSDHGFKQAPYEEINEEEYQKMVSVVTPLKGVSGGNDIDFEECAGGMCPIK